MPYGQARGRVGAWPSMAQALMSFLGAVSVYLQPCVCGCGSHVTAHDLGAGQAVRAVSVYAVRQPIVCANQVLTSAVNGAELTSTP